MYILGIGTGCCGTKSLARLLDAQDGAHVTHERRGHRVEWGLPMHIESIVHALAKDHLMNDVVGDVGFYWLPAVDYFLERFGADARVVAMTRGMKQTVKSYVNHAGMRDWWTNDNSHHWSPAFPTFRACASRLEALETYVRMYHERVHELFTAHPDRVFVMETEKLNDQQHVRGLLNAIGFENPRVEIHHANKRRP